MTTAFNDLEQVGRSFGAVKCDHCGEILKGETCVTCGGWTPPDAKYCCWCGASLAAADGGDEPDDELDFSSRVLCSDGSCIGVIGPDGRCKECGKPYSGEPED